jgi:hypothetical protein
VAKESVEELLKEVIEASNRTTAASDRTTRAIRAFVLFLFIQLTFTTIAAFLFWAGASILESTSLWDSGPRLFGILLTSLAVGVFVTGILLSSVMGWRELAFSKIGLEDPTKEKPLVFDYSPSTTSNRYPTGGTKPNLSVTNNEDASEGRVCSGCVKYTTKVYCEHCGEKD